MRVDIDAMRQALAKYTEGAGTARNVLQSVQSVSTSINGVWTGQASSTYQATIHEWCGQYGRVVSALDMMRDALSGNIRILEQAEHDANSMSRA
jgi:WXG100 family type VII secretion target